MAPITRRNFTTNFHHDTYPSLQSHISSVSLSEKSAFITGSGTGIGAATALAFAKSGAKAVFLSGRTAATLQRTKNQIIKECPKTIVKEFVFDISEGLERVDQVFSEARKLVDGSPIDILVNNAADLASIPTVKDATSGKLDIANFDRYWRQFEVNVKGSLALATVFLKHAPADGATIINTTSGAAVIDFVPGLSGYGVSKMAALKMFTYLWYEEQDRNLKVFHIHPGIVPSAMASEGNSKTEDKG
jgi:NAD(P)-dependent dehydrogenase (short-subunit alcohol dehydrogenase family)